MKIAWLSSWPPRPCGIATYSDELIRALRNANHTVDVICHPDGGRPGEKHVYPVMKTTVLTWGNLGELTLPGILGVNVWIVIVILTLLYILLFYFFEKQKL